MNTQRELPAARPTPARRVLRHWRLGLGVILLSVAIGHVIGQLRFDTCVAEATVDVHLGSPLRRDNLLHFCERELESPTFLIRVVDQLRLREDPLFQQMTWHACAQALSRIEVLRDYIRPKTPPTPEGLAGAFQKTLHVRRLAHSDPLAIAIRAPDEDRALRNLRGIIAALRASIRTALLRRPEPLSESLAAQTARIASLEAYLRTGKESARTAVRPSRAEELPPAIDGDRVLEQLRGDLLLVRRQLDALGTRFGPKHPDMVSLATRHASLLKQIDDHVRRVIESSRSGNGPGNDERNAPHLPAPAGEHLSVVGVAVCPEPPYSFWSLTIVRDSGLVGLAFALVLVLLAERRKWHQAATVNTKTSPGQRKTEVVLRTKKDR